MRDLVQLASTPKTPKPHAERAGQRAGDHAFTDILHLKADKGGTEDGKEAAAHGSPPLPSPPFRIKLGDHSMTAGHPGSAAAPDELLQHLPAAEAATGETGDDMAEIVPSGDQIGDELESSLVIATPDEAEAVEPTAVIDATGAASHLPPAQAVALAVAQAPREDGLRSEGTQNLNADAPDIMVSPPAARAAGAQAAKQADRAASPPAPAMAQKTLPVANGPASPRSLPIAEAEAGEPDVQPAPATANKAAPKAADAPARQLPLTPMAEAPPRDAQSEPVSRTEPASRAAPSSAAIENRQDMPRLAGNVRVVEMLSVPAPQAPSPAASITNAVASTPQWMSFARSAATASVTASSPNAQPVKSLTIQLNPAELGAVTAKLRLAGDQLTIELQVDRAEAYDRLSTDREAILKAVRALGIEVDKVTLQQQPQAQSPVNTRGENSAAFNSGGRDANFSAPGGSGGRESGETGGGRHRDGQDDPAGRTTGEGPSHPNNDGRGLYI